MSAEEVGMGRCRPEIAAAKVLSREGFPAQAVSRCHHAAFYAAEAALLSLGESRSKHAGVISAFGQLVLKREGLGEQAGRLLRSLYDRRSHADYDLGPVPQQEADQAIRDAETVPAIIQQWLNQRSREPKRPPAISDHSIAHNACGFRWSLQRFGELV